MDWLLCVCFSTPAYDHAPNPDKQWILRVTQQMKPIHRRFTDLLMTKRLQTLQSVDAAVERVYQVICGVLKACPKAFILNRYRA